MKSYCMAAVMAALALASTTSPAQVPFQKFDSQGHPKSPGIRLTVMYPPGWQAHEGEAPDSIQMFSGEYKDIHGALLLSLHTFKSPVEEGCRNASLLEAKEGFSNPQTSLFVTTIQKIVHEARPAFSMDLLQKMQGRGVDVHMRALAVCRDKQMVMLMCAPSKADRDQGKVISSPAILDEAQAMCADFFSSLVVMEP